MNYVFLGGVGEVGESCLLLSASGRYLLFDCGIRVNRTGTELLPGLALLKESVPMLDAIDVLFMRYAIVKVNKCHPDCQFAQY